jgi:hypothetical protein
MLNVILKDTKNATVEQALKAACLNHTHSDSVQKRRRSVGRVSGRNEKRPAKRGYSLAR